MKLASRSSRAAIALASAALLRAGAACADPNAAAIYAEHCASCHGAGRLGGQGPALIPDSLARLGKEKAQAVIAKGRPATQMPAFVDKLDDGTIAALAAYIHEPLAETPVWGEAEIEATRTVTDQDLSITRPSYSSDPLNLFVVVESGDHHVTILDGGTFAPLHRFASRYALHGGPKFTADGRFVFFASRDGWITKFDLWRLAIVAEVRAGLNTRNIALSKDGNHVAVANYLPNALVVLAASDLKVEKVFDVRDRKGTASRVSAVYQAPPRNSFIAALKDVPEIWEIATDPNAPPVYTGLVHNYEKDMAEALPSSSGLFALRRIEIEEPLDDFFFDQGYRNLLGSRRDGAGASVVNLVVGRPIARVDMPGLPHLGSGISFDFEGRRVMAAPHLKEGMISVIDLKDWSVVKRIETSGPGFFLRSHERSRTIWADAMLGATKDTVSVIDKMTLEVVAKLQPAPGKAAGHVEFDRTGRHALLSVSEMDGALVVYDAETLKEVKRLPMSKPSGKYNVYNKITFSEGTSH